MDNGRLLVMLGQPQSGEGPPTVILGVTDAAWAKMRGAGLMLDVDGRAMGLDLTIALVGGETHAAIAATVAAAAGEVDASFKRGLDNLPDVGVPDLETQISRILGEFYNFGEKAWPGLAAPVVKAILALPALAPLKGSPKP